MLNSSSGETVKNYLITIFLIFSISCQASFIDEFKLKARPILLRVLGKDLVKKILGPEVSKITLPKIPEVKKDPISLDVYSKKERVKVKYDKKKLKQYNYSFLRDIFKVVRRYEAEKQDIIKWMNTLQQNGSREGVYRAIVLDGVYLSLENHNFPMEKKTIVFTNQYLRKYLGRAIKEEKLKKANFFTVKRDVTEKTLEVIDELFKLKGDEVYDWYALFSAEMALVYPKVMDNKIRKITDPIRHKRWAKSVPDQYVKSEIIIKLHKVFNIIQG